MARKQISQEYVNNNIISISAHINIGPSIELMMTLWLFIKYIHYICNVVDTIYYKWQANMVCHYLSNPNRSLEFGTRNGETSFDFTLFLF